jgi:lysophospholipase L1-like esterase
MRQILIYGDSLTWGIIPTTRERLPFAQRWPGIMERRLEADGQQVRVIEDCLNGRRTAWDDPYKPGRNGLEGVEQRVEVNSPHWRW